MSGFNRLFKIFLGFFLILLLLATGCASSKKYVTVDKRKQSLCDLTHLGKNKYYYSDYYARKLHRSERKIEHR